jgi:hypothetical protein
MRILLISLFILCLNSCRNNTKICDDEIVRARHLKYKIEGCIIDSLEQGVWTIFDESQQISQTGRFDSGLHVGTWFYGSLKKEKLKWVKYENKNLSIKTNVPIGLNILEDSATFVKFSNEDSSNLFNLVISIHKVSQEKLNVVEFYKGAEKEILERQWKFTSKKTRLDAKNDTFYIDSYQIDDKQKGFSVMQFYTKKNDSIINISCRFNAISQIEAERIFYGIISSFFFDTKRVIDPLEEINIVNY